jgi:hypothetical protein
MMIRNDSEWRESLDRISDFRKQIQGIQAQLKERGLVENAIKTAISPQEIMIDDIVWEVALYERLRIGDFDAIPDYTPQERGKALICLRIAKGWTQRQLADALVVSEGVVSRDERHDYHGISMEKYGKVLAALGFEDHPRFVILVSAQLRSWPITILSAPVIQRTAATFSSPGTLKMPSAQEA